MHPSTKLSKNYSGSGSLRLHILYIFDTAQISEITLEIQRALKFEAQATSG